MYRIEHNAKTGEITQIDLTAKEIAILETNFENMQKEAETQKTIFEQEEAKKLLAKTTLLTKLGITEDEAKLLLS